MRVGAALITSLVLSCVILFSLANSMAASNAGGDRLPAFVLQSADSGSGGRNRENSTSGKVIKTDEEWRQQLTPEQYYVTRQKGTERAFTGEYYNLHSKGIYLCVCCGQELFSSKMKFDSGTGWPSFWAPIARGRVSTNKDHSLGMDRT